MHKYHVEARTEALLLADGDGALSREARSWSANNLPAVWRLA